MGLLNFFKSKDLTKQLHSEEIELASVVYGYIEKIRSYISIEATDNGASFDEYVEHMRYSNDKFGRYVKLMINHKFDKYNENTGEVYDLEKQLNILGNEIFNCSLKRANRKPINITNFIELHNQALKNSELMKMVPLRKSTGDVINHLCNRADVVLKDDLSLHEIESSVLMIIIENTNRI